MFIKTIVAVSLGILVSGCVTIEDPITNVSADQLRNLYTQNVKVTYTPQWTGDNGELARAVIYNRDGTYVECNRDWRTQVPLVDHGKWTVVSDEKYGALFGTDRDEKGFDPKQREGFYPVLFDIQTGIMAEKDWVGGQTGWTTSRLSHFQKSWPVVFQQLCPSINVPDDIPINQKQTSERYLELIKQDPTAILRK
jgi:hypothetical protein